MLKIVRASFVVGGIAFGAVPALASGASVAEAVGGETLSVHTEAVPTTAAVRDLVARRLAARGMPGPVVNETEALVDIGSIVNIGKQIWDVVQENAPVVNIKYDYANALPRGVASTEELAGFSNLVFQSYVLTGTNNLGMNVYTVEYTLVHQFGGSFDGQGQYLATVAVVPTLVRVNWGYKVDILANAVSTVNVGTKDEPIGSVTLELSFTSKTAVQHTTKTTLFQFRGDTQDVLRIGH